MANEEISSAGAELDEFAKMRERFRVAEELEMLNRISAEDALRFYFGEQWQAAIERERTADGRPCFTLNKLPAILKQVLNESRQNPPHIQVNPVSDGASEDTAEALQGLTRHVEANGEGGEVAYETGMTYMVIGGFGHWRILTDYLPKSFDQDAFLERIKNPFSVYWGPHKKLDKSDAKYCFITSDVDHDSYVEAFPNSEWSGAADFTGIGDRAKGWVTLDRCRVVEYFEIESEEIELVKLDDGRDVYEDEIPAGARIAVDPDTKEPITRKDTRKTAWVGTSNGVEWLKPRKKLPTDDIPVVTVTADELYVDGEERIKGMVTDLIEPARLFNYNSTAIAETMALGSKAQWVATAEQIEPYLKLWKSANSRNITVLPYKHVAGVNPPSKVTTEPPIQAMSEARSQSADDLRSMSGVYDATQSPNGGEESGRAVLARRRQASMGNANYNSNLGRGIKRTAQILVKLFPKIYDVARVIRITGNDQQPKQIMVHAGRPETLPAQVPETVKGVFDLSVGRHDVTFSIGKSDETKRQETTEMLLSLCAAAPALIPIIGDLVVNEMDFAGKKAIVERLQRALPPGLQDNQNPTDPKQLAAHNTQLMQQNQQLMQQVQALSAAIKTKQVESESRERVEGMKLTAAQTTAESRVEQEKIKAQAAILTRSADKQFDASHDHAMSVKNHLHNVAETVLAAHLAPKPAVPEREAA